MGAHAGKTPFNFRIYHDQDNGHIQWVDVPIVIKLVLHGLYMTHINSFIWNVPRDIGGVGQSPFSDSTDLMVDFIQYIRLAVTLGITWCVAGSYRATCDYSTLSCES